jgi:hypothetical protein
VRGGRSRIKVLRSTLGVGNADEILYLPVPSMTKLSNELDAEAEPVVNGVADSFKTFIEKIDNVWNVAINL